MAETDISTSSRYHGRLSIDPAQVRGVDGPVNPALIFPLVIALDPLTNQQQVVVTEVRGELALGPGTTLPGTRLGHGAIGRGVGGSGHVWASHPTSSSRHMTELRFDLTPAQMQVLEMVADSDRPTINFTLRFQMEMAWLREERPASDSPVSVPVLDLLPVAYLSSSEMSVEVSRSQWSDSILPGLGRSGLRLVALRLPARGRLPDDVVAWYDEARLLMDRGDFRGAVGRARDVRHAVEKHLGADRSATVAIKLAELENLPSDSPAIKFLDGLWQSLAQATNSAHHLDSPGPRIRAHEARAVLLVMASTLEYLQSVLDAAR